jgi:hypothetical protein
MEVISHTKGNEKLLNKRLRRNRKGKSSHTRDSNDFFVGGYFQAKSRDHLQKVSKFKNNNARVKG